MSGTLWKWYFCMSVEMAMPILAISIHPPITGPGPNDRFFRVKRKNGRFVWWLRNNSLTLQPQIETV